MNTRLFLDLLFPKRSLTNNWGDIVYENQRVLFQGSAYYEDSKKLSSRNIHHIDMLYAAGDYHQCLLLQNAIKQFKYSRVVELQSLLGNILCRNIIAQDYQDFVLCPVPLHWTRLFQRGFNQAEMLAIQVSRHCNIPVENLLTRCRATGHQARKSKSQRQNNMQNSFRFTGRVVPNFVLLIDDVCTTGSTLDGCAKTLKSAGVQSVHALVLAHG